METFLIRALQFVLSLSLLVFIHELGHFAFARIFGVRVHKFYLFFNPRFSLLRAKKINGRWQVRFFAPNVPENARPLKDADGNVLKDAKGEVRYELIPESEMADDDWRKYPDTTEWGIGWIPLGGYCKIAGMIDESMDTAQLSQEPQRWEYRSRPAWQRLLMITGGVMFNFILAIVIYIGILFSNGKEYFPIENARYGLHFTPTMTANGFRNGDNILAIDGEKAANRSDIVERMLIEGKRHITVSRDGASADIVLPEDFSQQVLAAEDNELFSVRQPFVIHDVVSGTPAYDAGMQGGDSIIGVNGKPMFIFQDIAAELTAARNTDITVDFVRNGSPMTVRMQLGEDGKLGVHPVPFTAFFPTEHIEYTFWQSIPAGIAFGWDTLVNYVKQFKLVFTKEGAKSLGGFAAIGQMFPKMWDWTTFWFMTAFLSIILAFMNILPIPALDGGHALFLIYEMVTRRKPSDDFMYRAQRVGLFILLALLILANGNDIIKLLK